MRVNWERLVEAPVGRVFNSHLQKELLLYPGGGWGHGIRVGHLLNQGEYLELLDMLSEYDGDLRRHLVTATVFTGTSGKIQNDLICY